MHSAHVASRMKAPHVGCLRDCELAFSDVLPPQTAMMECVYGTCAPACVHEPGCGPFAFNGEAPCSACLEESCCEPHEACSDIECLDFFTCRQSCTNEETCRECLDLWPAEVAGRGTAMVACGEVRCAETCGDPGTCGVVPGLDSLECRSCVQESCCDASKACGGDPDCAALQICVGLCDEDGDCIAACREDLPAGAALLEPLETCKTASCDEDCP